MKVFLVAVIVLFIQAAKRFQCLKLRKHKFSECLTKLQVVLGPNVLKFSKITTVVLVSEV